MPKQCEYCLDHHELVAHLNYYYNANLCVDIRQENSYKSRLQIGHMFKLRKATGNRTRLSKDEADAYFEMQELLKVKIYKFLCVIFSLNFYRLKI